MMKDIKMWMVFEVVDEDDHKIKPENIISIFPTFGDARCEAEITNKWDFCEVTVSVEVKGDD